MIIKYFVLLSLLMVNSAFPADSSFWAGSRQDGVYPDTGLLQEWPENGPVLLWQVDDIGTGYSTVGVVDDRVFVSGMVDNTGTLFAFDHAGNELWRTSYGAEWTRTFPGTRSTPVVYDGRIYIETAQGVVFCFEAAHGEILWQSSLFEHYGGDNIQYGLAESVLIHGDMVICTPGGVKNNIVALNRLTGDLIWSSAAKSEPPAYCSPTVIQHNGRNMIITITASSILALELETGNLLWDHIFYSRNGYFPNTPIYRNGFLYSVSGYRSGGIMLQLSPDGEDVKEIWRNASLDNLMGGVVEVNGFIYGAGHMNDPSWQCLDWHSGEARWSTDEIVQGGVITADGLLFCYSEDGMVHLVQVDPTQFRLKGSFAVEVGSGEHFAHPVLDNGRLYIRHGSSLQVFNVKQG